MKVFVIFGTRPEAIKLAPVIAELRSQSTEHNIDIRLCSTTQHGEMLDQVLSVFHLVPDYALDLIKPTKTPLQLASSILCQLESILQDERPEWVLVQGDTTTVMAASIAAFYSRCRVGHIEAGLRTYDRWQPFPEEINRQVVSVLAHHHFAPTPQAKKNLLQEHVAEEDITVTGNTGIDALHWIGGQPFPFEPLRADLAVLQPILSGLSEKKIILVTAHRRENFGEPLKNICHALKAISLIYEETVQIVFPVHLNPEVWGPVHEYLGNIRGITLTAPLDYLTLMQLMRHAYLVLTDSGGIQEEAPALGVPVLVLRNTTERPEGIEAGVASLIGTDHRQIVEKVSQLLNGESKYKQMAQAVNPYGDGLAAKRIVDKLIGNQVIEFDYKIS